MGLGKRGEQDGLRPRSQQPGLRTQPKEVLYLGRPILWRRARYPHDNLALGLDQTPLWELEAAPRCLIPK